MVDYRRITRDQLWEHMADGVVAMQAAFTDRETIRQFAPSVDAWLNKSAGMVDHEQLVHALRHGTPPKTRALEAVEDLRLALSEVPIATPDGAPTTAEDVFKNVLTYYCDMIETFVS